MVVDEDEAIWNAIKDLPDVECLPLPVRFFKKFGIEPRAIETTKEYLATQYTFKKQFEEKDLPPLIVDEPLRDKDGKIRLVEMAPLEDVKVEVIQRPFEHDPNKTLVVHPSLKDEITPVHIDGEVPHSLHHTTPSASCSETLPSLDTQDAS